ncbi:hypothetical protein M758_11G114600 [Ceratodon purpureus]|nr:hypothetical protein M758_11G114600 [Ceratodon purpureus]
MHLSFTELFKCLTQWLILSLKDALLTFVGVKRIEAHKGLGCLKIDCEVIHRVKYTCNL